MASSASTPLRPMDGGLSGVSTPPPATPARAAVDVVALTTRDEFLLELGATLGGQASINPVESAEQVLEQLTDSKRTRVVMIDGRSTDDVAAAVETLQSHSHHPSIVVFAAEGTEDELTATLRDKGIVSVLPLPVDAARTSAAFAEAIAAAKARQPTQPTEAASAHAAVTVQSAPVSAPIAASPAPQTDSPGGGRSYTTQIVLGGIAALIIAGGLVAYFMKGEPVAPTPAVEDKAADAEAAAQVALPAVETSIVKGKVDELLEKARLAMRERRYTEPAGDNALLYYRSAAATDATSAEALDGLNRVAAVLTGRIDEAFEAGQLEEAATTLAQFKNASPDDPRVATYQQRLTGTQISKAMADGNLDRAAALVRAAQQNNLLPAQQVSRWRSEITRLQGEAREKRAVEVAAREAAAAAEQKKVREARAAAAEAERTAQAERDKQREEQLKAEQAAQAARATASPSDVATAASAPLTQASLKRKRYVAPEYPMDALARRVGGVVQVAFTVDSKGEPRDVEVVGAEPKGIFDRAAIAAVKRWRYEPPVLDGAPTEVPVRMQIRFAPDQ